MEKPPSVAVQRRQLPQSSYPWRSRIDSTYGHYKRVTVDEAKPPAESTGARIRPVDGGFVGLDFPDGW